MNLALVHDRLHIKGFWEKKIHADTEHAQTEQQRMSRSALSKYGLTSTSFVLNQYSLVHDTRLC